MDRCVSYLSWCSSILIGSFALTGLVRPSAALDAADIERHCRREHPNITQYFARRDCVKSEMHEQEAKQKKRREEERARPCIANDISRMEVLAERARSSIDPTFSIEDAQSALASVFGYKGNISIADDNLKERVLVHSIRTACNSSFHFLVNLRVAEDGSLRWYRTWAENAPGGYKGDYQAKYSIEFDRLREQERQRVEAANREEQLRESMAKMEREREVRRKKYLNGIKISNVKLKCVGETACLGVQIEFDLTNGSASPVADVSLGWMIRPPNMSQCPENLATNKRVFQVLQPGQTVKQSVYAVDVPAKSDLKLCIQVTEMRTPYVWEN